MCRRSSLASPRLASLLLPSRCDLGSRCADSDPSAKIWRGCVTRFATVTCRGFGIRLRDSLISVTKLSVARRKFSSSFLFVCKVFSCRCDDDEWNLCWRNSAVAQLALRVSLWMGNSICHHLLFAAAISDLHIRRGGS
jgi:hypothetical protein